MFEIEQEKTMLNKYINDKEFVQELIDDGVRVIEEYKDTIQFRDTLSGLPFFFSKNGVFLHIERMASPEHDITDSFYSKDRIYRPQLYENRIALTNLNTNAAIDVMGNEACDVLGAPIAEFVAKDD